MNKEQEILAQVSSLINNLNLDQKSNILNKLAL